MNGPAEAHVRMLEAVPELGPWFGVDYVLGYLSGFMTEHDAGLLSARAAGDDAAAAVHEDALRRAFDYIECLHEHAPPGLVTGALEGLFRHGMAWPEDTRGWIGPRTAATLRDAPWAPPELTR